MIAIFPEIVAASAQGDVERLAVLARRYYGGGDTYAPRPDVRSLLLYAGVDVETLPLGAPGAVIAKDERGTFQIVAIAGEVKDPAEARFLLAHMLGHVLLDVLPVIARGDWQVSGLRETVSPLKRYVQGGLEHRNSVDERRERLADRFAAALLMPLGMVRRAEATFKDLDKTAHFFGVPRSLLERRLQDIGVLTPAPVNFLDAEGQLGGDGKAQAEAREERRTLTAPEPSMPRSYAASSYGQTERSTRRDGAKAKAGKNRGAAPNVETPADNAAQSERVNADAAKPPVRGMDRIRELARRMDQGERAPRRK